MMIDDHDLMGDSVFGMELRMFLYALELAGIAFSSSMFCMSYLLCLCLTELKCRVVIP